MILLNRYFNKITKLTHRQFLPLFILPQSFHLHSLKMSISSGKIDIRSQVNFQLSLRFALKINY